MKKGKLPNKNGRPPKPTTERLQRLTIYLSPATIAALETHDPGRTTSEAARAILTKATELQSPLYYAPELAEGESFFLVYKDKKENFWIFPAKPQGYRQKSPYFGPRSSLVPCPATLAEETGLEL